MISTVSGIEYGNQQDIGSAAGLKNIKMYKEVLKPGHSSSAPHRHTQKEELVYVLSGEVTAFHGDRELKIGPGESVSFLPDNLEKHYVKNNSKEEAVTLIISRELNSDSKPDEVIY